MEYPDPDYPAAPPPAEPLPEPPRRQSRIAAALRHPQASAAALAFLIGFASVLSAVIAWRASLASIESSRYESLAVQQQAREGQLRRELEGLVAQDMRFVNVYQEHALAARELKAQADSLRASDPATADELDLESQARLDLARAIQPFFQGASGITLGEDGTVAYDTAYVLQNLYDGNVELRELLAQRTPVLATRADAKALSLVGVAALIVAALFFLTIAQVSRARARVRQLFFVAGGILVLVGTLGFVIVEVFA